MRHGYFSAISLLPLDCIADLDVPSMIEIKMRDGNSIVILSQFKELYHNELNYVKHRQRLLLL